MSHSQSVGESGSASPGRGAGPPASPPPPPASPGPSTRKRSASSALTGPDSIEGPPSKRTNVAVIDSPPGSPGSPYSPGGPRSPPGPRSPTGGGYRSPRSPRSPEDFTVKGESFRKYRTTGLCMTDAETTSAGESTDTSSTDSYTSDEDSSSEDEQGSGTGHHHHLRHSKRGERSACLTFDRNPPNTCPLSFINLECLFPC